MDHSHNCIYGFIDCFPTITPAKLSTNVWIKTLLPYSSLHETLLCALAGKVQILLFTPTDLRKPWRLVVMQSWPPSETWWIGVIIPDPSIDCRFLLWWVKMFRRWLTLLLLGLDFSEDQGFWFDRKYFFFGRCLPVGVTLVLASGVLSFVTARGGLFYFVYLELGFNITSGIDTQLNVLETWAYRAEVSCTRWHELLFLHPTLMTAKQDGIHFSKGRSLALFSSTSPTLHNCLKHLLLLVQISF